MKKPERYRAYDVVMIRKFLAHLKVELLANHLEHAKPAALNRELAEDIFTHLKEYPTALLVVHDIQRNEGLTDAEWARALQIWCDFMAARAAANIEHLEALEDLFSEATWCAHQSAAHGKWIESGFLVKASQILDGSYFSEKSPWERDG